MVVDNSVEGHISLPCGHVLPHKYVESGDTFECKGITEDCKGRVNKHQENEKCDKVYRLIINEVVEDD